MEGLGNMSHIINMQRRSQCAYRNANKKSIMMSKTYYCASNSQVIAFG